MWEDMSIYIREAHAFYESHGYIKKSYGFYKDVL